MYRFPPIYRRFIPQLLYMIVLPIFCFAFILIYRPLNVHNFLGTEYFGIHITLVSCIMFIALVLLRLLYYFLPLTKLNYASYIAWCLGEMVFISFFVALYLWLVLCPDEPYLEMLSVSFKYVTLISVIPYVILSLSLRIYEYHERMLSSSDPAGHKRIRFYDEKHNLKIVLASESIQYISAEENYVRIYYLEHSKVRNYVLRSSMKALEEICLENGLVRCHRSYFVNPQHIKTLRKEQEGVVFAELDASELQHVPVSKRYVEALSALL